MMLILAAVLIIFAIIWYVDSKWETEEFHERDMAKNTSHIMGAYAKSRDWLGQIRLPFQKDGRSEVAEFKQWLDQTDLAKKSQLYKQLPADARDFVAWVEGLSDEELNRLVAVLSTLCRIQQFDLAWLVDPQTPDNLKQAMEDTMILHCLTAWRSRDIQPLVAYKAWQAAPNKSENWIFAQMLYSKLAEAGLITPPANMVLATDKERQDHVAKSIDTAAAEKPAAFLTLMQEVISELEHEKSAGKSKSTGSAVEEPSGPQAAENPA